MYWRLSNYFVLVTLLCLFGCSGSQKFPLVPVSGKVTFDGAPLAEATVYFQPQAPMGQNLVGPGSYGQTNADGVFTLKTVDGRLGAVPGMHVVRITTAQAKPATDGSEQAEVLVKEKLPKKYHEATELNYTVPETGSENANFDLTSK